MNFFLLLSIFMIILGFVLYQKNKLDDFALGMIASTFLFSSFFWYLSIFSEHVTGSLYLTFFGFYLFVVPASTLIFTSMLLIYKKTMTNRNKVKEVA